MPVCLQILDKRMGKLVLQKSVGLSIILMPKTIALLKAHLNSKEGGQLFTKLCTEQNEESRMRDLWELILYPETSLKSSTYIIKFDIEVTEEKTYNRMPSGYNASFYQILESGSQDSSLLLMPAAG